MGSRGGWVALLLLSFCLLKGGASAGAAGEVDVSNGEELLEALNDTSIEFITLTSEDIMAAGVACTAATFQELPDARARLHAA